MNQSQYIYPTKEDIDRLRIIIETKSTGANIHTLMNCLGTMSTMVAIAERIGWEEKDLKIYNEEKEKLYKLLLGVK